MDLDYFCYWNWYAKDRRHSRGERICFTPLSAASVIYGDYSMFEFVLNVICFGVDCSIFVFVINKRIYDMNFIYDI